MVVEAGKCSLLIRYNNYKKTNFIEEHNKVVSVNGFVWMLKAGRRLVDSKVSKVINETALLILKAPKSSGGDYYYAEVLDFRYGDQENKEESPDYYENLVEDERLWQIDSLTGTWLKIGAIKSLDKSKAEEFKFLSNGKRVVDVINSTMSSSLYVCSDKKITL